MTDITDKLLEALGIRQERNPLADGYISAKQYCKNAADPAAVVKLRKGEQMSEKSLLIKDTTREERIRIVNQGLSQCGGACDFCNGCDNIGGGKMDDFFQPYIDGEKELRELNMEYAYSGRVHG